MNEVDLAKRLQKARKSAGLTQQQLCEKTGQSYSTLAKIERGAIKAPSVFTIAEIAKALNTSIEDLLGIKSKRVSQNVKKTSLSGIKFVYFDINGCLVRFFHRAFGAIAEDTGTSPEVVESTMWHYNDAVCRGEISIDEYNSILGKKFNAPNFDWAKYYIGAVEPVRETVELLKWTSKYYHFGLLSNIMPGLIKELMKNKLIPDIEYDAIIDSSDVKAIKPERKIFEIANKAAKEEPGAVLLIDDSRANLMAAEKFGWKVLWFDDYRPAESVKRIKQALEFKN